jgi:hypothetical protein
MAWRLCPRHTDVGFQHDVRGRIRQPFMQRVGLPASIGVLERRMLVACS